jgi:PAS domain S-box-containing protein
MPQDNSTSSSTLTEETLRRQNQYLAALQETALGLVSRLELNELLQDIVSRAGALVGTNNGYVFLLNPETDEMTMRVGVGVYENFVGTRATRGVALAGRVWASGAPVVVDDYQTWGGRLPDPSRDVLRAVIGVPLKSRERVSGILGLAHLDAAKRFGAEELDLLTRFAALAAVALDNAQLYESAQRELAQRRAAEKQLEAEIAERKQAQFFLDSIVDSLPTMLFVKEANELRFVRWNKAGEEITGHSRGEFIGKNDYDFFPKEEADFFVSKDRQTLASGQTLDIPEEPIQVKDGTLRWLHTRKVPIWDAAGKPAYLLGISEDITERKRAEDALRDSEERFRRLAENTPSVIYVCNNDARYTMTYLNDRVFELTGYPKQDFLEDRIRFADLYHPDDVAGIVQEVDAAVAARRPYDLTYRLKHKDGEWRWVHERGVGIYDEKGALQYLQGTLDDITEQRRADEALREAELIVRNSPIVLFRWSVRAEEGWPVTYVSRNVSQFGYSAEEFLSGAVKYTDLMHPSDVARVEQELNDAFARGINEFEQHYRIITRAGEVRYIEDRTQVERDANGTVTHTQGIIIDVTERYLAEQELRSSQALYQSLVETIPQSLTRKDRQGRVTFGNSRYFEDLMAKPEDIYGKTDFDFHPRELAERYWQDDLRVLNNGEVIDRIEPHVRGDGKEIIVRTLKTPIRNAAGEIEGVQVMFWDITEEQQRQEQIRQQNAYLNALQEMSVGLMQRLDVNALLQDIVARAGELVGTEHGYVFIKEPGAEEMELRVGVGAYEGFVGRRTKPGVGLAGEVWQNNAPVVVDDYRVWSGRLADASRDILRAVVGVPLRSGSEVIGVIGLAHLDETRKFGAAELAVLERFAQLAAIALDNARLYEAAQEELAERTRAELALARQLRETELLNRVASHAASLDVDKALLEICRDLAEHFGVQQSAVALFNPDRESLTVVADYWPGEPSGIGLVIPVAGNPSTEIVLQTRRPAAFSDAQNDPRLAAIQDLMRARKTASILIAPLFVRDDIIGTLGINSSTPREFSDAEIALVERVCLAIAPALENARLYRAVQQELAERTRAEGQARQRNLELESLNRVAAAMMSNVPLEASLREMARELTRTFRARNCGIALLNPDHSTLTVVADALDESHEQYSVGIVIPVAGNASSEYVIENKKSLVINDPQNDPLTATIHERMRDRRTTCLAIIPLMAGDQVIGTIGLDTTEAGRVFTDDEIRVAETMASQMASAIEKQRLLEAAQREVVQRTRAEQIQNALFRIADAVNTSATSADFYATLHALVGELVYAPNMYVALYDAADDMLDFVYFKDEHDELADPVRRRSPAGKRITTWVIKQGQPLLADEATLNAMNARGEIELRGNPSVEWLGIPLKRGGETFGMFAVQSYTPEHVYSPEDLELLLALAPEISNAITRREEQEALVRRNRELAVLNRVTQTVSLGTDLPETLNSVAREMVDVFQARNCGIALYSPDRAELIVVASATRSPDEPSTVGVRIPIANNPSTQRVLETRQSLVIEDAQTDPLTEPIHDLMKELHTHSLLIVPLLSGGEVIGTVGLDLAEPNRVFSSQDVRLAETIANQMANAIEKQRLFDQTRARARREQLTREINARLTRSLDRETILQTMARELSHALGASHAVVRIGAPAPKPNGENQDKIQAAPESDQT